MLIYHTADWTKNAKRVNIKGMVEGREKITVGGLLKQYPSIPFGDSSIPTTAWMNMGRQRDCTHIPDPSLPDTELTPEEHGRMAWALGALVELGPEELSALEVLSPALQEHVIAKQALLNAQHSLVKD